MNDRDRMKEQILAALQVHDAVDASTAMTLWTLASKIETSSGIVPVRFIARMLDVLYAEGKVDHDGERDARHGEPTRFWMRSQTSLSDAHERLQPKHDPVLEAHEHEEMQLPTQDNDEGVDLDTDG